MDDPGLVGKASKRKPAQMVLPDRFS